MCLSCNCHAAGVNIIEKIAIAARHCFGSQVDTPQRPSYIDLLRAFMERVTLEDLGITSEFLRGVETQRKRVFYFDILESPLFSMVVFILGPDAVIPLHDHPAMTVVSKIMHGTVHLKSFDWIDRGSEVPKAPLSPKRRVARRARIHEDVIISTPQVRTLYPTHSGNLHSFHAHSACVLFDVLGPPYSEEQERECQHYVEIDRSRLHLSHPLPDDIALLVEDHPIYHYERMDYRGLQLSTEISHACCATGHTPAEIPPLILPDLVDSPIMHVGDS